MRRLPTMLLLRRLRRDRSAVTIVEFAMIAPVMLLLLLGLFDLGYRTYATSVLQGALTTRRAWRQSAAIRWTRSTRG